MSVPGNVNTAPPPSSFDDDPDFYEESRWAKLRRRIIEEPLIPLGCALTSWALFEASRSIRVGNKERTNRMFRRRIYAQFFTIAAMVAGSFYWESDRAKRRQFDDLSEEKRRQEKSEAWIKELEARDQEEEELRRIRDKIRSTPVKKDVARQTKKKAEAVDGEAKKDLTQAEAKDAELQARKDAGQPAGGVGKIQSVLEDSERRGHGPILAATRAMWESRR